MQMVWIWSVGEGNVSSVCMWSVGEGKVSSISDSSLGWPQKNLEKIAGGENLEDSLRFESLSWKCFGDITYLAFHR